MTAEEIEIRTMQSSDEIPLMADMLGKSSQPGYLSMWEQAHRAHSTSPYFHPKYTRLAIKDGQIVGHLRIQPNLFKLGEARLWVGGIGDVVTHFAHKKKGIASALLNEAVEFMKGEGFDISILFGIPNFYHRFGFAPIIPQAPVLSLTIEAAEGLKQDHRYRTFQQRDIPKLLSFKDRHDMLNTLSVCRTPAHWPYRLERWKDAPIFYDRRGRLVGYAQMAVEGEAILIREVVTIREEKAYGSVLHEAARRARRHVVRRIELEIPFDHPLAEFCAGLGCRHTAAYHKNAGGMGRIINLNAFLSKMVPEWNRLLSRSELAAKEASLRISVEGERILLRAASGRIQIVNRPKSRGAAWRLTPQRLLQIVVGYPGARLALKRVKGSRSRRMAEIIFPPRWPFIWRADGY